MDGGDGGSLFSPELGLHGTGKGLGRCAREWRLLAAVVHERDDATHRFNMQAAGAACFRCDLADDGRRDVFFFVWAVGTFCCLV